MQGRKTRTYGGLKHGPDEKHAVHVGSEGDRRVGELGDAVVDEQRDLAIPQPLPQLRALGLALLDVHDLKLRHIPRETECQSSNAAKAIDADPHHSEIEVKLSKGSFFAPSALKDLNELKSWKFTSPWEVIM